MKKTKKNEIWKIFLAITSGFFLFVIFFSNSKFDFGEAYGKREIDKNNSKQKVPITVKNDLWKRPEGPLKVGLQVGHWKNQELPDELKRLREKGGGTQGGGKAEWEVNLEIAKEVAKLLEAKGVAVDILPATVPEQYWADVVVAIHADGNEDGTAGGFKVAPPWRDLTRKSSQLAQLIEKRYQEATNLKVDPNVTRNMRGYYAFNWRKYRHAIHPMSTAVIIETGFLTNSHDRNILVKNPALAAEGISQGIFDFFDLA